MHRITRLPIDSRSLLLLFSSSSLSTLPFPARRSSFITILWHVSRSVTMFDRLFTTSSWDERELVFSGCERPCRSLQCREIVSFIFLPLAIIVYTTVLMYLESSRFGDFRGLDFEGNKRGKRKFGSGIIH